MNSLAIFVSSTYYDLKSLREHIRSGITDLGHEPILSEYPSFPVSPDLTTVENCKKVVKARADVLVLIIGGKRGSLDSKTSNSVVNEEYREARSKGIDCIVFADKSVWDLLPVYRKNPGADFTPTVDSPAVFQFLNEVIAENHWVFTFTKTDEILTALRIQLSTRFQELLARHRAGRLNVLPSFTSEPEHIARIATDRSNNWEMHLVCELMRDRTDRLTARFLEINNGFVVRRTKFIKPRDTLGYIQDLLSDMGMITMSAKKILEDQLNPAFGVQGVPGDAVAIRNACDNIYSLFLTLFEWELDVRFIRVHEIFAGIFPLMSGWTNELLNEVRRIPLEIDRILSVSELKGEYAISLKIASPKKLPELVAKLEELSKDPNVLKVLQNN